MSRLDNANFANKAGRLIPLFLVIFIDSVSYFLVIPVFLHLFFNDSFGLIAPGTSVATRNLIYGLTIMLTPLAFLMSAPLIGNCSDKHGRKPTILLCLIFSLTGFILPIIGITHRYLLFILLGRFLTGLASASQPVAQAAIADFTSGKEKAFYLSLIAFAMTLAMILGSLGGGYFSDSTIVRWFTVMTPYWVGGALALLNIILLTFFYRPLSHDQKKPTTVSLKTSLKILFQILWKSNLNRLLLVFFSLEFAWSQYYQAVFLYLTEQYHYTPTMVSLFTAYIGFWMCLGLTLIYRIIVRYWSLKKILWLSLMVLFIGFLGCAFLPYLMMQWLFVILVALGTGIVYASLLAIISNHASAAHQGWVMGVASTCLATAWMITGFLSGWLINMHQQLPFIVAWIAIAIGVAVLFTARDML